jgi:hypothetical protein
MPDSYQDRVDKSNGVLAQGESNLVKPRDNRADDRRRCRCTEDAVIDSTNRDEVVSTVRTAFPHSAMSETNECRNMLQITHLMSGKPRTIMELLYWEELYVGL